jgi:hypothetical protein
MTNKSLVEFASQVASTAMLAKKLACEDNNGPVDGPPILVYEYKNELGDNESALGQLPMPTASVVISDILEMALTRAFEEFGPPSRCALISEVYVRQILDKSEQDNFRRGQLRDTFVNNPQSDVSEALSIYCFDSKGELVSAALTYSYDDRGVPVFRDVKPQFSSTAEGLVPDAARSFMTTFGAS